MFRSNSMVRGIATASLLGSVVLVAGSVSTAFAETTPAPALTVAMASLPASMTVAVPTTETAAVATETAAVATETAAVATETAAAAKPKKLTRRQVRALVARVGRARGLNRAEVKALLWLCKRESNFHPNSRSKSGYHGLFQLSKGMAKGKPWRDPTWNTKRAIRYMRGRYGGVLQAKAFWSSHHWY